MAPLIQKVNTDHFREALPFSKWTDVVELGAGVADSYTFQTADVVRISYTTGTLYVRADGGTAEIPGAAAVDGTGSEYVPSGTKWQVAPGQTISLINASNCSVSIGTYKAFVTG